MIFGVDMAVSEITLVLFTTLAPSGVVALLLMGFATLLPAVSDEERQRINRFFCVPLVVSMVGLVMSATHLGNPNNVLYVFSRIGSSPLSNEVAGAVVFLALAGMYWLYSFAAEPRKRVQKVWFLAVFVAGIAFVWLIAFAYAADTIISWDTAYVPANVLLNALVGGPIIALASLRVADVRCSCERFMRAILAISPIALIANVVCLVLQNASLDYVRNEFMAASDLVWFYGFAIVAFCVLSVAAIMLCWVNLAKRGWMALAVDVVACVLVLVGIFATRFVFYAMHMTMGLGM